MRSCAGEAAAAGAIASMEARAAAATARAEP